MILGFRNGLSIGLPWARLAWSSTSKDTKFKAELYCSSVWVDGSSKIISRRLCEGLYGPLSAYGEAVGQSTLRGAVWVAGMPFLLWYYDGKSHRADGWVAIYIPIIDSQLKRAS